MAQKEAGLIYTERYDNNNPIEARKLKKTHIF
jgi:hypothetical protein